MACCASPHHAKAGKYALKECARRSVKNGHLENVGVSPCHRSIWPNYTNAQIAQLQRKDVHLNMPLRRHLLPTVPALLQAKVCAAVFTISIVSGGKTNRSRIRILTLLSLICMR
jgi:hypothetical protein